MFFPIIIVKGPKEEFGKWPFSLGLNKCPSADARLKIATKTVDLGQNCDFHLFRSDDSKKSGKFKSFSVNLNDLTADA